MNHVWYQYTTMYYTLVYFSWSLFIPTRVLCSILCFIFHLTSLLINKEKGKIPELLRYTTCYSPDQSARSLFQSIWCWFSTDSTDIPKKEEEEETIVMSASNKIPPVHVLRGILRRLKVNKKDLHKSQQQQQQQVRPGQDVKLYPDPWTGQPGGK